ncbi:unnamed protein product [Acanthoscelides obtectus]|uniref:Uncharacterized protein n=1 Tax=Acanthoscelides obtectus TaxID=200917 RepID=A0A9P0PL62_ACAOB|nr:unnamed protein product [Acanthoscelides obtectus]CAK1637831.1 hypothetical protein AOBTE_LOCUS10220 [Acanthoscelides obtectus]
MSVSRSREQEVAGGRQSHGHSLCGAEPSLIQTPPSVIAAACIASAVRGLKLTTADAAVRETCSMLNIALRSVEYLVSVIDSAVASMASPQVQQQMKEHEKNASSQQGYESPQYGQPETPTEVESIYF